MEKHSVMSPELVGILSIGAALGAMVLTGFIWTNNRIDRLDDRFDRIEQNQAALLDRTERLNPVPAIAEIEPSARRDGVKQ